MGLGYVGQMPVGFCCHLAKTLGGHVDFYKCAARGTRSCAPIAGKSLHGEFVGEEGKDVQERRRWLVELGR